MPCIPNLLHIPSIPKKYFFASLAVGTKIACEGIRILSLFQHPYPICCAYARKYPFEGTLLFFEKIVSFTAKKYVSYPCEGTRAYPFAKVYGEGIRASFFFLFCNNTRKDKKDKGYKVQGIPAFCEKIKG